MKTALWSLPILIGAAVMLNPVELRASDPVGVYCIVEKVVMEPNETSPVRIQVWGAFALSDGKSGYGYLPPQYGYMYFTIATGQEQVTRAEWSDLKKVAGTGELMAFGGRYAANGRIRKATDKPDAPDAYAIVSGITRLRTFYASQNAPYNGSLASIVTGLKEALRTK